MKARCPKCHNESIQMITSGANVVWKLTDIDKDGDPMWEQDEVSGDVTVEHVCAECGHKFHATCDEELVKELQEG